MAFIGVEPESNRHKARVRLAEPGSETVGGEEILEFVAWLAGDSDPVVTSGENMVGEDKEHPLNHPPHHSELALVQVNRELTEKGRNLIANGLSERRLQTYSYLLKERDLNSNLPITSKIDEEHGFTLKKNSHLSVHSFRSTGIGYVE